MNKRFMFLLLSLTFLLTGCRLAQPESGSYTESDRLVGVFVTTEYLDLFHTDEWLQDNAGSLVDGGTVTIPNTNAYQGRIYAQPVEETVTNSSGETHTTRSYEFPELNGMVLAGYRITEGDHTYQSLDVGEGICEVHNAVRALNEETVYELTGTIFVACNTGSVIFYLNPVYQTSSGEVYVVSGSGLQFDSSLGGEASQSVSDSVTTTENGESKTSSTKIEVKMRCIELADKIILIQMDSSNNELARAEFLPGKMPEEFTPLENTAYLIIEEHRESGVYRSLHQSTDDYIEIFYSLDDSLCLPQRTTVNWKK